MTTQTILAHSWVQKFMDVMARFLMSRNVAIVLSIAAVSSCFATYVALTQFSDKIDTVYWLLNLDLILLLLVGTIVSRQIVRLWIRHKRGVAGSRFHVRLVFVFGILATAPAILMAIFSSIFLYFGVHAWFNDHVSTAINKSLEVAEAYLKEHQQVMRADVLAMANDLNRAYADLEGKPAVFAQVMQTQSMLRNLPEAIVFRSNGAVIAKSKLSFSLELDRFPQDMINQANSGEVALMTGDKYDRIRGLVKLDRFFDAYLYVGRLVDASVLQHMQDTTKAVEEYTALDGRKSSVQIAITAMFGIITLLLLMGAVWFGLAFSEQIVTPISTLIQAAERVRAGDLSSRVPEDSKATSKNDEISLLGRSFNRMTSQLQSQQTELLKANSMLEERRRFTEAVLSSASSGIIGLDDHGVITLANGRSHELLQGQTDDFLEGRKLSAFIPESDDLFHQALEDNEKTPSLQIEYAAADGPRRNILLRITAEQGGAGAVATIDDISALVSAQRSAAWADVARRIAHEIKNPLTPIQLSAERLKRKYLPQIEHDPETFEKCTETIIRQVNDIGHMVSEFSSYARMPVAVKKCENIGEICQSALVLLREAHPDITFELEMPDEMLNVDCDRSQINQVITNLLQNAIDSIHERIDLDAGQQGKIILTLESKGANITISVADNGVGLPEKVRDQLLEPYVTTKKKGSGLGLAIARRIMEDHAGSVNLEDYVHEGVKSGAKAVIVFPRDV